MNLLTIVNRTSKDLKGTWDGRHVTIPPGESAWPVMQAEAFKRQNPVMGSEDPRTGWVDYLIGIKDYKEDCSPIEQSDAIERWNRKVINLGPVEVVPGKTGVFSGRDVSAGLPLDAKFVKP